MFPLIFPGLAAPFFSGNSPEKPPSKLGISMAFVEVKERKGSQSAVVVGTDSLARPPEDGGSAVDNWWLQQTRI